MLKKIEEFYGYRGKITRRTSAGGSFSYHDNKKTKFNLTIYGEYASINLQEILRIQIESLMRR